MLLAYMQLVIAIDEHSIDYVQSAHQAKQIQGRYPNKKCIAHQAKTFSLLLTVLFTCH